MSKYIMIIVLLLTVCCFSQTHTTANLDTNNVFTGSNSFTQLTNGNCVMAGIGGLLTSSPCLISLPIYLNSGTATSQGNECNGVTNDSIGDTSVVAVAALRTIVAGVGHDVLCVVTTDATNPGRIGTLVFPGAGIAYSANSAPSQGAGVIEALGATGGVIALTNNGGTTRKSSINFRSCGGPGATGCGTDLQFMQDSTNAKLEEWEFLPGGANSTFYMGGLGSTHQGIYFGGSPARTNSPFGFDGVSLGQLSHLLRLGADGDIWNPATLVSGTVTVNFQRNHTGTLAPLCLITWQGVGTLTGIAKCVVNGSAGAWTGITISSSVGSDTAKFAYLVVGDAF